MLSTLLVSAALVLPAPANADDWPHLRGPRLDGHAADAPAAAEGLTLRLAWTAPLGPAYSGVVVDGHRVVTTFSDDVRDHVVALDARSGAELWRHDLGPTYRGHDGSEDGPISSPVVDGERAYAVGPRGLLVALALEDGRRLWSTHLVDDLGAKEPEYGFTTTPLREGELLIVQAGGADGRLLCAFDAATGEARWSVGDGEAGYTSPVALDLAGRRQVVVPNGDVLLGVAPETGAILWRHELGERSGISSGLPVPVDGERFLAFPGGQLAGFRVLDTEAGFRVEETFRSRELGRTYAAPVVHDGHVYGFKSSFLTCVDATTGARVWKSRPPGGRGLILVGDRLVVFGAEGVVALARATPEGYAEEARLQALAFSSFAWPAYADGRVLVRNAEALAAVELVPTATPVTAAAGASDAPPDHLLGRLAREAAAASDPQAVVDAFLAEHPRLPLLEGELVHFLWRGDAQDVAVAGSMTGGVPEPLERIPGTDLHGRTYRIAPGARWEYRFQVDFDEWATDPANPDTVPHAWGDALASQLVTPGYELPEHVAEPAGARGRTETFELASERLGNTRELTIWLPPGYDEADERYPLLIVHEGDAYLEQGRLANTLENLVGTRVRPLVVAFVPPIDEWWYEGGGSGTEEYLAMLATELVPRLAERYRLSEGAADRALLGKRSFGMTAVCGALLHPDVFGKAAVQSLSLNDVARHRLFRELAEGPRHDLAFYVGWSRYEARDADRGVDSAADSRRLVAALEARGYPVAGGEALDAHGWGGWRADADDLLEALFPLDR